MKLCINLFIITIFSFSNLFAGNSQEIYNEIHIEGLKQIQTSVSSIDIQIQQSLVDISSDSNTNDELSHEYLTPVASIQGVVGDDGWEWLNYPIGTNQQFHRPADSNEEWVRWE